jgi:predicted NBD/HSP70 family sugar kinase
MRGKRLARPERCTLGIDAGGTNIRAGLFCPRTGSIRCARATQTESAKGGSHSLGRVAALARDVVEEGRAKGLAVHRVGIGIPELVGPAGQIESSCSLPWRARSVHACLRAFGNVTIASNVFAAALVRRAQQLGSTAPDAITLCRTALEQPGIARDVVDSAATELAVRVAILANALEPTLIVLGGGLGCAPGRYWSVFRSTLPRHTWGPHMRRLPVRQAQLGTKAGLIGAALSAIEA